MPVKIRLQRRGRKKRPFYHIVVADARAPRDGRFIEKLGTYNPMTKPATIVLDREKAYDWLMKGAQPTDTARAILRFKGVLYRKHLMRGVAKGSLTAEEADTKYQEWIDAKESKIAARFEETKAEIAAFHAAVSGVAPPMKVKEEEAKTEEYAPQNKEVGSFADSVEQTTVESVSEAPAPEPVAEAPAPEPVKEEAPAPEPVAEAPAPEPVKAKPDDLKKIEGIGPKIAEMLNNAGILTFTQLADSSVDKLKEILATGGKRYTMHDPTTWPQQSKLAANGEWDALNKLQDELDGGKVVAAKPASEEE